MTGRRDVGLMLMMTMMRNNGLQSLCQSKILMAIGCVFAFLFSDVLFSVSSTSSSLQNSRLVKSSSHPAMKDFFDTTGGLWKEQRLAGVPDGFFVSMGTQGGDQETTAWTVTSQLAHPCMIYVPIGYTFGVGMFKTDSLRGGLPSGASVSSGDGSRKPSLMELALAEPQGRCTASIVKRFPLIWSCTFLSLYLTE